MSEIRERIATVLTSHFPQDGKCRCGQEIADTAAWASHTAGVLDEDGRRWVAERIG